MSAVVAVGAACGSGDPARAPKRVELGGQVVDARGQGIAGATVAVVARDRIVGQATSGADGRFGVTVPAGVASVSAVADAHVGSSLDEAAYTHAQRALRVVLPDAGGVMVRGRIVASGPVAVDQPALVWPVSRSSGDAFALAVDAHGEFAALLPRADRYIALVASVAWLGTVSADRVGDEATLVVPLTPRAPAPPEVGQWLATAAAPLASVEAGHGFADLAPVGAMVGDAQVVGLGEATHGTREFFQLKHRLLEYLVAERGFTLFAMEVGQPECRVLNAYVLHGTGDARSALAALDYFVWDTEEVLAMVEWMRAWNADPAHARKVQIVGFDMQQTEAAEANIIAYVKRAAPGEAVDLLRPVRRPPVSVAVRTAGIAALEAWFARRAPTSPDAPGRAAFEDAAHDVRILAQAAAHAATDPRAPFEFRDRAMAENLGWILDHQPRGTRVVVWAHNGHVGFSWRGVQGMGGFLRQRFGTGYRALGFMFGEGGFRAVDRTSGARRHGMRDFTVGTAPDVDVSAPFTGTGHPTLAVDLRTAPPGVVADWLAGTHPMRDVGLSYAGPDDLTWPTVLTDGFDGLLFVARTTAARPVQRWP